MRLLTVPNWSFGREKELFRRFRDVLEAEPVLVHYLQTDVDHNRTVSAFSGDPEIVRSTLLKLAEVALPSINLNRHVGVHPRIGGLDVCPFFPLPDPKSTKSKREFKEWIEGIAEEIATTFELPVFLYEKSEKGRHESDLPSLRKGGFGGLLDRELNPDFGPTRANPLLGATVMGWRDFLIAMNVNLRDPNPEVAQRIAKKLRDLRNSGEQEFLGVRALGFMLASQELSQVSINVTLPDITAVDPILQYVIDTATDMGVEVAWTELIGVIREQDLPTATLLPVRESQIIFAVERKN